jgi:hypothetical protein
VFTNLAVMFAALRAPAEMSPDISAEAIMPLPRNPTFRSDGIFILAMTKRRRDLMDVAC